jgi:hypothetical protein
MPSFFAGSKRYPYKMNLTTVEIRPLPRAHGTSSQQLDSDFQEPTGPYSYMAPIELYAQVVFEQYEKKLTALSGDIMPIVGRLVFRNKDLRLRLEAEGLDKLKNGDLITKVEDVDVEYEIVEVRPTAWLRPGRGVKATPQTMTAYFSHYDEERAAVRRV